MKNLKFAPLAFAIATIFPFAGSPALAAPPDEDKQGTRARHTPQRQRFADRARQAVG